MKNVIGTTFPLGEALKTCECTMASRVVGKVIIELPGASRTKDLPLSFGLRRFENSPALVLGTFAICIVITLYKQ